MLPMCQGVCQMLCAQVLPKAWGGSYCYPCLVDRTREVKSLAESHTSDNRPSLYPADSKLLSLTTAHSRIFMVSWLLEQVKGQQRFKAGEGGR